MQRHLCLYPIALPCIFIFSGPRRSGNAQETHPLFHVFHVQSCVRRRQFGAVRGPIRRSAPIDDSSNIRSSHLSLDPSNICGVIQVILLVFLELRNILRPRSLAFLSSGSVAWHHAEWRVPQLCFSPLEPAKNMGMEAAAHLRFQHMEQTTRLVHYYYQTVGGLWGQSNMAVKKQ